MRQIQVQVPIEAGDRVVEVARDHQCEAPLRYQAIGRDGAPREVISVALPNSELGRFVESVTKEAPEAAFVFSPAGVLVIEPPLGDIQRSTRRVETRSPTELVLDSLQSVGTWTGMLAYAAFSGIVAAYAVIFDLSFLLVAAMLIAPVGAPAMVTVIGAAVGDAGMIRQGVTRFAIAIVVLALGAIGLGLLYGMEVSTATMEQISSLSGWTGFIAVVGGAAGALSQIQSDRDSLVTGTATGFLIAVSLSPPAAVLGLAITIQRWDYAGQMAFVLVLTLTAIIAGGWLTLHLKGVRPGSTGVAAGKPGARTLTAGLAAAGLLLLVVFQLSQAPSFRKADLSSRAVSVTRSALEPLAGVRLLEASARFTRRDVLSGGDEALIVNVWIEEPDAADPEELRRRVRQAVADALTREINDVVPYVDVVSIPQGES